MEFYIITLFKDHFPLIIRLIPVCTPGNKRIPHFLTIHTHTQTANCEPLMDITKSYGLDRIWINAEVAERLGIADGDEVILSNTMAEGPIKVKVTERINPTAIYMPSHYGCKSPDQHTAYGVGLNFMDFVPFHMEPAYGSAMTQETLVSVQKVGE